MLTRIATPVASAIAAFALALALSGGAIGVALVAETLDNESAPAAVDTTATFEDLDGNGIDDDCQAEPAVANPSAEASAATAVDQDGDGTISPSEAAHSDRVGGKNCNHGGYVSSVAKGTSDGAETETEDAPAECDATTGSTDEDAQGSDDQGEDTGGDEAANAHGKAVSKAAKSDAVGGKNCNHGGAVSEAAHGNKPDKAEKDAAKAAARLRSTTTRATTTTTRARTRTTSSCRPHPG